MQPRTLAMSSGLGVPSVSYLNAKCGAGPHGNHRPIVPHPPIIDDPGFDSARLSKTFVPTWGFVAGGMDVDRPTSRKYF